MLNTICQVLPNLKDKDNDNNNHQHLIFTLWQGEYETVFALLDLILTATQQSRHCC